MRLLLIFLTIPIIEIALFIQVGGWIGLWPTLGLVVLTAVAGAALMRTQGLRALDRLRAAFEGGRDPTGPIADGAMILVGGMLLLTPGFFTDTLGLLLLLPPVRAAIYRRFGALLSVRVAAAGPRPRPAARSGVDHPIEAEYEVLDDVPPSQRGASGWTRPQP
jgi:UPF0716 protein FxsA